MLVSKFAYRAMLLAVAVTATPAMAQDATLAAAAVTVSDRGDANFRQLHEAFKQIDEKTSDRVSIPSRQPVDNMTLSSGYGMRTHPVLGGRRQHKGIDIPKPTGTPVYATADGTINRAGRAGGYGNLVEINHGNDIQTRYGHLSRMVVAPGQDVRKGDLIGYVGSTGRSTGPHLHYEVRLSGQAVNPLPFIEGTRQQLVITSPIAVGGPE